MYAIFYEVELKELFDFIVKCYINNEKVKENYYFLYDEHFLGDMLSYFLNNQKYYEIEKIFGSKEKFNKHCFLDDEGKFQCSMYLYLSINHLYSFENIIQYFQPLKEDINLVDAEGDNALHYFSESTSLFNEMGIDESIQLIRYFFNLMINQYGLDLNLKNKKGITPTEYLLSRPSECKDIRNAFFRYLYHNYKVEFDLNKLIEVKAINEKDLDTFNNIIIDVKKSKLLLEIL